MMLPFMEPKYLYKASDPKPSREAAEHIVASGHVSRMETLAAKLIIENPGRTAREIEQIAGMPAQLHKRLASIERKGWIKRGESRRCEVSGRNVTTWLPAKPR
jgi:hypothetical protein